MLRPPLLIPELLFLGTSRLGLPRLAMFWELKLDVGSVRIAFRFHYRERGTRCQKRGPKAEPKAKSAHWPPFTSRRVCNRLQLHFPAVPLMPPVAPSQLATSNSQLALTCPYAKRQSVKFHWALPPFGNRGRKGWGGSGITRVCVWREDSSWPAARVCISPPKIPDTDQVLSTG